MLVLLFRILSKLPLPALHALGSALGWLVYACSPSYRRRMKANMLRAGFAGQLPQAIAESGKSIVELAFVWCADPRRVARLTHVDNMELVAQAKALGRGVIFLTPHLGCFEMTAQALAHTGPLTVMYRPPKKKSLVPLIEGARARTNLMLAPANFSGVRILAKALKKGQPIGILPDQVPQHGDGAWAEFFGLPAYTMTLPIKLQQMSGAVVILTYAERLPYGRGYLVRFLPFEQDLSGTIEQQARAVNIAMEKLIATCPAQYFWSYNRYKTPDGVSRQDAVEQGATSDEKAEEKSL